MSISGALSNALSGLTVASRSAEVVASNISNASTPGYGPRALEQAARVSGGRGGAMVLGVTRQVDPALQADFRTVSSSLAAANTAAGYAATIAGFFGEPGDQGALSTRISDFETALVSSAADPSSTARLGVVAQRATDIAQHLNTASDGLQAMRAQADTAIARDVDTLNARLHEVVDLNTRLRGASGHEAAALADLRDGVLNDIAQIVPIRVVPRANNAIAIYSPRGAQLVDGPASTIGFDATPTIMPHMTRANGLLSGLTLNDRPLVGNGFAGALTGGRLGALFELRDHTLVQTQQQLDGFARELGARFQSSAVDPTLGASDAGLFTDSGARISGTDETGLAGRLAVNSAISAEPWRLRDGIAAAAPGPVGNAQMLNAMLGALDQNSTPSSTALAPVARDIFGLVSDLQSTVAGARLELDRATSFQATQHELLKDRIAQGGVDTDSELQKLMLIEQNYAANARVVETIGSLIDSLMRI